MKKKFNRHNQDSSANSSRSGSFQSLSQYSGRERGLDFSSLMLYIQRYNLTEVKMFQNKFGLDGDNKPDWITIVEKAIAKMDPKDSRLSMILAMLSAFGGDINYLGWDSDNWMEHPYQYHIRLILKTRKTLQIRFNTWLERQVSLEKHLLNRPKFKKINLLFKKFNQQQKKNVNPSSVQIKSELIRRILENQKLDLKNIMFERLEQELINELQRAGRMVYIHENGVFPSQSPIFFLPMQFSNNTL